ncbi:MAG: FAD-dependent oxidoreductase [Dehalococcoidia bacterium]
MLQVFKKDRMWRNEPLKERYDVVIVGAGVHGLATAYYLSKRGITNVALLDKGYLGGGASARSTAILRANYVTTEGIPFFHESLKLYEDLAQDLNYNLLFSQFGRLELAHAESSIYALRIRAEFNAALGVESRIIGPEEIRELVPPLDMREGKDLPILAGLYHPPAGVIRHDAVIWAYARAVDKMGAEVHPFTEVMGIQQHNGRVVGVETNRGNIEAEIVVNCTAGWSSTVAEMVGLDLAIVTHPLQALVTEPLKPFLRTGISSTDFHVYIYQTDRGELVIGGAVEHYPTYAEKSTYHRVEELITHTLDLLPCLREVNVLRQWAGLCDMTPDYVPIMGIVPGIDGFLLNCGWGTYGFKAAPIAGKTMAELIATGRTPDLIKPFSINRFSEGKLVNEKGAAASAALH